MALAPASIDSPLLFEDPPSSPSSLPSLGSVSSRSGGNSAEATSSQRTSNLPVPPPADRVPLPKGRSTQQKPKASRKGKAQRNEGADLLSGRDEDWTLEDPPMNGQVPRLPDNLDDHPSTASYSETLEGSQLTARPPPVQDGERKKKQSRGRALAKKTSQLFSRRDKERPVDAHVSGLNGDSTSSLRAPSGSRQASYSSTNSRDSQSTTNSSLRHPFSIPHRPSSANSGPPSPRSSHSRRLSQDSQTSWQAASRANRSGTSLIFDSSIDPSKLPIPQRQASNMSASVPSLSRHALPLPSGQAGSSAPGGSTLPTRMSNWFSNLIPSTSTAAVGDSMSSPESLSSANPPSPLRKPPSVATSFLNAARQKAVDGVRHLLDSEAQPDRCIDTMWVMGVGHPGWRPATPSKSPILQSADLVDVDANRRGGSVSSGKPSPPTKNEAGLRPTAWTKKQKESSSSSTSSPGKGYGLFSTSNLSLGLPLSNGSPSKDIQRRDSATESPSKGKKLRPRVDKEVLTWPDQFYDDFRSRVWCSYRGQYAPILSLPSTLLIPSPDAYYSAFGPPMTTDMPKPTSLAASTLSTRPSTTSWSWSRQEERGLTTDSGWGCMLRTGQSMLANAIIHLQLGRDWRLPPCKPNLDPETEAQLAELDAYASYVKIMSWFFDDPSPLCPFGVHRMALIGKELGKEVGEWFGPSTAAGALKTLANSFPLGGLAVATATDSMIYKSDVYAASNLPSPGWTDHPGNTASRKPQTRSSSSRWGSKAVLILVGLRLGLDGVHPMYHDTIKTLFTFSQSVGIAGGRPSSSYYFVAWQGNSLFYLDPHLTRPAIPLEVPPAPVEKPASLHVSRPSYSSTPKTRSAHRRSNSLAHVPYTLDVVDVDDMSSEESDGANSPSSQLRQTAKMTKAGKRLSAPSGILPTSPPRIGREDPSTPTGSPRQSAGPFATAGGDQHDTPTLSSGEKSGALYVDPQTLWYASAYSDSQLRTFHCDKVKKMPLSGLDPSMLLGFLCRDEADFEDFCVRINQLPQKIFSVQDEPPSWDQDDDTGLESVSEPDLDGDEVTLPSDVEADDLAGRSNTAGNRGGRELGIMTGSVDSPLPNTDAVYGEVRGMDGHPSLGAPPSAHTVVDRLWQDESCDIPTPTRATYEQSGISTRPKLAEERTRTDSWIQPSKDVQEAPNGASVL